MPLGTSKSLSAQPRPLCILSKEVGPCSNRHLPLWQMPNDVTYCQQLHTDQAEGWAAAIALSWWRCRWTVEDIRLINALDNNNSHFAAIIHTCAPSEELEDFAQAPLILLPACPCWWQLAHSVIEKVIDFSVALSAPSPCCSWTVLYSKETYFVIDSV